MTAREKLIRAAGGVVWRQDDATRHAQIAVVHRPRYDDWSLPKGKVDGVETELATAVREIDEEICAQVAVQQRLRTVSYKVDGVPKTVDYWVMRYLGGEFFSNEEVDELRWLCPEDARVQLTYDLDCTVVEDFIEQPRVDATVIFVRHAKAGKRSEWKDDDDLRPLEPSGERQATALVEVLRAFAPTRVLSAPPVRCVQTVRPLADSLELRIRRAEEFGDGFYVRSSAVTEAFVHELARSGDVTVICSQGTTIPDLVRRLDPKRNPHTRKGEFWVLSFAAGTLVSADHYPAPTR